MAAGDRYLEMADELLRLKRERGGPAVGTAVGGPPGGLWNFTPQETEHLHSLAAQGKYVVEMDHHPEWRQMQETVRRVRSGQPLMQITAEAETRAGLRRKERPPPTIGPYEPSTSERIAGGIRQVAAGVKEGAAGIAVATAQAIIPESWTANLAEGPPGPKPWESAEAEPETWVEKQLRGGGRMVGQAPYWWLVGEAAAPVRVALAASRVAKPVIKATGAIGRQGAAALEKAFGANVTRAVGAVAGPEGRQLLEQAIQRKVGDAGWNATLGAAIGAATSKGDIKQTAKTAAFFAAFGLVVDAGGAALRYLSATVSDAKTASMFRRAGEFWDRGQDDEGTSLFAAGLERLPGWREEPLEIRSAFIQYAKDRRVAEAAQPETPPGPGPTETPPGPGPTETPPRPEPAPEQPTPPPFEEPAPTPPGQPAPPAPQRGLPAQGWVTPMLPDHQTRLEAERAGAAIPYGLPVQIDRPREEPGYATGEAVKVTPVTIDPARVFDPWGILDPDHATTHKDLLLQFGAQYQEPTPEEKPQAGEDPFRRQLTDFVRGQGFDGYIYPIGGDFGNRELVVLEQPTPPEQPAPPAPAPEPEPTKPTWETIEQAGGQITPETNIPELVAAHGERSVQLTDEGGGTHIVPASWAADLLSDKDLAKRFTAAHLVPAGENLPPDTVALDEVRLRSDADLAQAMVRVNPELAQHSDTLRELVTEQQRAERRAKVPKPPAKSPDLDQVRPMTDRLLGRLIREGYLTEPQARPAAETLTVGLTIDQLKAIRTAFMDYFTEAPEREDAETRLVEAIARVGRGELPAPPPPPKPEVAQTETAGLVVRHDPDEPELWAVALASDHEAVINPIPVRNEADAHELARHLAAEGANWNRPAAEVEAALADDSSPESKALAALEDYWEEVDGIMVRRRQVRRRPQQPEGAPIPLATEGNEDVVTTEAGSSAKVHYAVAEGTDLIPSHLLPDFRLNPAHPGQGRGREAAVMQEQVRENARELNARRLGESAIATEGAPVINRQGVVRAGNGRVLTVLMAYNDYPERADGYRAWLSENAGRLGLDPDALSRLKRPVLVRVADEFSAPGRSGEDAEVQFALDSDVSATAARTAAELAAADAERLTAAVLQHWVPNDNGDPNTAANRTFVRRFLEEVVPSSADRNRLLDREGNLTQDGVTRIRNALFMAAYDDRYLMETLAVRTEDQAQNLLNALMRVAPRFALLRSMASQGQRFDLDIAPLVAKAGRAFVTLTRQAKSVEEFIAQPDLEGGLVDPDTAFLLRALDVFRRSGKKMTEMLVAYQDAWDRQGDPRQVTLGAEHPPATEAMELLRRIVTAYLDRAQKGGGGEGGPLFAAEGRPPAATGVYPPEGIISATQPERHRRPILGAGHRATPEGPAGEQLPAVPEPAEPAGPVGRPQPQPAGVGRLASSEPGRPSGERPAGLFQRGRLRRAGGGGPLPRPAGGGPANAPVAAENELQIPYLGLSKSPASSAILVPRAIADATLKALDDLNQEVGDVDEFVRTQLQYRNQGDLFSSLDGPQIDAVALAIRAARLGRAVIIGDMMGQGKGRILAAMLRWHILNNERPVFCTHNAKLFTDLYRDWVDVTPDARRRLFRPFIMFGDPAGNVLDPETGAVVAQAEGNARMYRRMLESPAAFESELEAKTLVLVPYTQLSGGKGGQQQLLAMLVQGQPLILDESHMVGGESSRGSLMLQVLDAPTSIVHSSATYAKRAETMTIYRRTSLGIGQTLRTLTAATERGGVALQQVLARWLARAGEYLRREPDFSEVKVWEMALDETNRERDAARIDSVMDALSQMLVYDQAKQAWVREMDREIRRRRRRGSQAGVRSPMLSQTAHHIVGQAQLAVNAEAAIARALSLNPQDPENGRKVVVNLTNTMEAFMSGLVQQGQAQVDREIDGDFRGVLRRGLAGTLRLKVTADDGSVEIQTINPADMPPNAQQLYARAAKAVEASTDELAASPIDYVMDQVRRAGVTVGEITGRGLWIDYSGEKPILRQRTEADKDRNEVINRFNQCKIDCLVFNSAGSTGISLHASEKFPCQRVRAMLLLQPDLNIDVMVQALGRINRKGQVVAPEYYVTMADLPAMRRPIAILRKKLNSLNANIAGDPASAARFDMIPDMLNEYGDDVANDWWRAHPEIQGQLPVPIAPGGADFLRTLMGKMALLPTEVQDDFYAEVEQAYQDLIDYLERIGENPLRIGQQPMETEAISRRRLVEGTDESSPFTASAWLERIRVKLDRKPYNREKVLALIDEELAGRDARGYADRVWAQALEKSNAYLTELTRRAEEKGSDVARARARREQQRVNHQLQMLEHNLREFRVGYYFELPGSDAASPETPAVVIGIELTSGAGSPVAPSRIRVRFAVASPIQEIHLPLSHPSTRTGAIDRHIPSDWDNLVPKEGWEDRWVITGNLVAAFSMFRGRPNIVEFTREDGTTEVGILRPRGDPGITPEAAVGWRHALDYLQQGHDLTSADGDVEIRRTVPGGVTVAISGSAIGETYANDTDLTSLTRKGEFEKVGNHWMAHVGYDELAAFLQVLDNKHHLRFLVPEGWMSRQPGATSALGAFEVPVVRGQRRYPAGDGTTTLTDAQSAAATASSSGSAKVSAAEVARKLKWSVDRARRALQFVSDASNGRITLDEDGLSSGWDDLTPLALETATRTYAAHIDATRNPAPETVEAAPAAPAAAATPAAPSAAEPEWRRDRQFTCEAQITRDLATALTATVRQGFRKRGNVAGYYMPRFDISRVKNMYAVWQVAHEVGHDLDEHYEWSADNTYLAELTVFGDPGQLGKHSSYDASKHDLRRLKQEGVAEFMRYYVQDPEVARANAPTFYPAFEDAVRQAGWTDHFTDAQKRWQQLNQQHPWETMEAELATGEQIMERQHGVQLPRGAKQVARWLITRAVDDLNPIRSVIEDATDSRYENLRPTRNAYILGSLSRHAPELADLFVERGDGDCIGLEEVYRRSGDHTPLCRDFTLYGFWRRLEAEYRLHQQEVAAGEQPTRGEDFLHGQKIEDVRAAIAHYEQRYPRFRRAGDELQKLFHVLLNKYEAQFLPREVRDAWENRIDFYVPMAVAYETGLGEEQFDALPSGASGELANQRYVIFPYKGSKRPLRHWGEVVLERINRSIQRCWNNDAMLALVDLYRDWRDMPVELRGTLEKVPIETIPHDTLGRELRQIVDSIGKRLKDRDDVAAFIEAWENLPPEVLSMKYWQAQYKRTLDQRLRNIVLVFRDGKPEFYKVKDRELYDALCALGPEESSMLLNICSAPAKTIRWGVTINPFFILYQNLLRDTTDQFVKSEAIMLPGFATGRGAYHVLRKDWTWEQMVRHGGGLQRVSREGHPARRRRLAQVTKEPHLWAAIPLNIWEFSLRMREASELSNRMAVYERLVKKLLANPPPGWTRKDIAIYAAFQAADMARFSMRGKWTASATRLIAFSRGMMVGAAKAGHEWARDPARVLIRGAAMALATLLIFWCNADDEDYWEESDYTRDNYTLIKVGPHRFLRIPRPFEFGFAFSTLAERLVRRYAAGDLSATDLRNLGGALTQVIGMNYPNGMQTMLDLYSDRQSQWGTPIVPTYLMEGDTAVRPEDQVTANTSASMKRLGKLLGMSPAKMEYAFRQTFGPVGETLLTTVDWAAYPFTHEEPSRPVNPFSRAITRPSPYPANVDRVRDEQERLGRDFNSAKVAFRASDFDPDALDARAREMGYTDFGDLAQKYGMSRAALAEIRMLQHEYYAETDPKRQEGLRDQLQRAARQWLKFDMNQPALGPMKLPGPKHIPNLGRGATEAGGG